MVSLRKIEKDEDFGLSINLVSDNFMMRQTGVFELLEKIKRIRCILRNKEYCYFDICMSKLKDFE